MATIILDVQDESLLTQIKKACQLLKGVASVRVHKTKNEDITKTAGYKEAMDDIKHGRVYHAESVDDMFKQISQTTVTNIIRSSTDGLRLLPKRRWSSTRWLQNLRTCSPCDVNLRWNLAAKHTP